MKSKLFLLFFLAILFAGFIGVRFFILDKQNALGKLKIISSPSATVFIDNVAIGKTPYEDKYKVGEFLVKLIPEGTATETASWQGKIKVYKNALTYINRELGSSDITSAGEIFSVTKMEKASTKGSQYGEVYVESDPSGAIVYLDNDEKGVGPLLLADVLKGEHELSVFLPGFFRRTQKINIEGGYRLNANFKMAIDQSQTPNLPKKDDQKEATKSATASTTNNKTMITIKETEQGWLRVREEPSTDATESAKVKPGEKYELVDEQPDWYKIKFNGNKNGLVSGSFTEGWVSSAYSEKQ
jgi:hypothetical protein